MTKRLFEVSIFLIIVLVFAAGAPQAQTAGSQTDRADGQPSVPLDIQLDNLLAQTGRSHRTGFSLIPSSRASAISPASTSNCNAASNDVFAITPASFGGNLPVLGSGTLDHLTKWTGLTSGNSFIGDSSIIEDKFGNVTIGTGRSTVTIAGTIQAAGGTTVVRDLTLQGNGTSGSPLGIALPLILTGSSNTQELVRVANTAAVGTGVFGAGGPGVGGTGAMQGGPGVVGLGGSGLTDTRGGDGVHAFGGNGLQGGAGLDATGGQGTRLDPGNPGDGGVGVRAAGGASTSGLGGNGVLALGGLASGAGSRGGDAIFARSGLGINGADDGLAGNFVGDVNISGKLTVTSGMKMFHIDHPLDPANKYLNHAAIESSEVLNVYSGNVTTDANGDAVIALPDWFEALNRDFRYQLTVVGTFAQAIVAEEIKGNRFAVKSSAPGVKVSWQVTGVRSDPSIRKFPLEVEETKTEKERGYYLNPDAYGQPEERGIEWARHSAMMQELKQRRIKAEQKPRRQSDR